MSCWHGTGTTASSTTSNCWKRNWRKSRRSRRSSVFSKSMSRSPRWRLKTEDRRLVLSMKRVVTAELLDTDSGTPAEIAASLDDLRRINRWFGGVATTEDMIRRVSQEINMSSLSLLEVAAGSGY